MLRYSNPGRFMDATAALLPWIAWSAGMLLAAGFYLALFVAPADYQQGEAARIMFVHVPAAWMAMFVYAAMAGASLTGLVFKHPLADVAAKAAAPLGACFTALALVTGMLWGKPMWGTYWVWDARLTSVLILFFVYLGYIALWSAIEEPARAARAAAIFCLVGAANLPVIHFSVDWWNTLHQPASVARLGRPAMDAGFLWPLLVMAAGYMTSFAALTILRMRTEILERRARALLLARAHGAHPLAPAHGAHAP